MEIRRVWVKLENTEHGVLLQREQGDAVFYAYGEYAPHPDVEGMAEDAVSGPTRLRGGPIWIRSRNWSRVSITPHDVDSEQTDAQIGSLAALTTDANDNLVDAVNWLNAEKADKSDIGELSNLMTPVTSSIVGALNNLEGRIDTLNSERKYNEDIMITPQMISDRGLTLPYTPIGIVQLLPYGGIPQKHDIDFITVGNVISWSSLSLELFLEVGDIINVQFTRG
jgi:hypothetical protein